MAAAKASGTTAVTMRFLFRPIPLKKSRLPENPTGGNHLFYTSVIHRPWRLQ